MMYRTTQAFLAAATATLLALPALALEPPQPNDCVGDCDGSGEITVDEIITIVTIALSGDDPSDCGRTADLDGSGTITVDEILVVLNHALVGCYAVGSCDDPAVDDPLCALDRAAVPCEILSLEHCMLPYPSSFFLREDPTTDTGYRVNYPKGAMPRNRVGFHLDPAEHNTLDGFTPGPIIIAMFPEGVDLLASDVPPILDIGRSLEADSPTVLLDVERGERVPHFAELDANAFDDSKRAFMIRPAVRLRDGGHYIVAIRGLISRDGAPVAPPAPFAILRDGGATPVRAIEARRPDLEAIFATLAEHEIERDDLQLAWEFVVASSRSMTERLLAMRDETLEELDGGAPPFEITEVQENVDEHIYRRVRGHFVAPLYTTSPEPPAVLNLGEDGLPVRNGTVDVPFVVNIPRAAVADGVAHPARPSVYGHGLFGSRDEVNAGHLRAFSNQVNIMFGATDWIGMSSDDVRHVVRMIPDLSGFSILPDRLQQAMLNFVLLGRLFVAEDGFVSRPEFQLDGEPLIDRQEVYYYGISQGGIQGGLYLAIAPDTTRGVLGVGAINYSFLLRRSIDFTPFQVVFNLNYLDELERTLLYPLLQQLWDRGEAQGYSSRLLENPFPGTPAKKILMQIAVNDSQVSHTGSEIQARSLGLSTTAPSAWPAFGIPERETPFDDSAYIPFHVGGIVPPLTNQAPAIENGTHEAVRRLPAAQAQIDAFLRPDGVVENFCPGPCAFENVPGVKNEE